MTTNNNSVSTVYLTNLNGYLTSVLGRIKGEEMYQTLSKIYPIAKKPQA